MTRYLSADYVFPVSARPIKNGTVSVNQFGEIIKLYDEDSSKSINNNIEKYEGIIAPGFVNTHCHLELSHLHQKFAKHQGLVPFIKSVITERKADENEISEAMVKADKTMAENGIVAVGDISNNNLSKKVKEESSIYYHTFVELLGLDPIHAEDKFKSGLELKNSFLPMSASLSPHAPYSVSKELFMLIQDYCNTTDNLFTIHNQESEEENKFFRYKTGSFIDFYKFLNFDIGSFRSNGYSSLRKIVPFLPKDQKILLVHNTYTNFRDIYLVSKKKGVSWCFCPNSNLYIENKLPKLEMFFIQHLNITLGTDSLASNDELCILSELKTICTHFPDIPLTKTMEWATLNGAKFLGIDNTFGSLQQGKTPGLNLITETNKLNLTQKSKIKKLV